MTRTLGAVGLVAAVLVATASSAGARVESSTVVAGAASLRPGPVTRHSGTGLLRFLGSSPGQAQSRPAGLAPSATPAAVARAFLDRHGAAFGVQRAGELEVRSVRPASAGRDVVRFQQVHNGVPVLGGELIVNLDRAGNLLSIGGEALPDTDLAVVPTVTPAAASATAVRAVATAHAVPSSALRAATPSRWIADARLLGGPRPEQATLVWRVHVVAAAAGPPVEELVLVDAHDGGIVLRIDEVRSAKSRQVCDAANNPAQLPCVAPVRVEGGAPSAVVDVNDAYDFAGDTYDFFLGLGRDSLDGAGMALKSTVRFCTGDPDDQCPWDNAAWAPSSRQMLYGDGFAHADDVVGHELTHGVTSFTSKLISWYQSGAIDESLSDVFGELIDLSNGQGDDGPAVRWLVGEDLPIGPIRDMEDPTAFGDPDRMSSPLYFGGTADDGGIHSNSGVNNKAAFLLVDGGTFNGRTVAGLGSAKTARIYHEANANLLTSGSDYVDLYNALRQACANLVGSGGLTSLDCTEVDDALLAVEMNVPRVDPPSAPGTPVASPGDGSVTLSWPPAASDGGGAITSHLVTPYRNGAQQPALAVGAGTSVTLGGLTNGNAYWFTVRAVTSGGTGPASTTSNSVIPKANQLISFAAISGKTWGDPDFTLGATASSGLPVGFTASGPCTVSGATVHIIGVGSCTITATQFGSVTVNPAPAVSQTFTIAKAGQTISFGPLPGRRYGDRAFSVGATASSGLTVSFGASGSCSVSGTTVSLRGAGSCTLTASQSGDVHYNAAASVSRTFAIAPRLVCRVPKVTGKSLAAAKTAIAKARCRTGRISQAYSRRVAAGKVVTQSRAAGKVLAVNTKVDLVVSRGARRR